MSELWQNVLVALDARGSDNEALATAMFDPEDGIAGIDIAVFKIEGCSSRGRRRLERPHFERYEQTENPKLFRVEVYDADWGEYETLVVLEQEMLEEKRDERLRVLESWRASGLFSPDARGVKWIGSSRAELRRASNMTAFDEALKSVYTDDAVKNIAAQPSPLFAMLKKEPITPSVLYVNPETYRMLTLEYMKARVDNASDAELEARQRDILELQRLMNEAVGAKVVVDETIPKDKIYTMSPGQWALANIDRTTKDHE